MTLEEVVSKHNDAMTRVAEFQGQILFPRIDIDSGWVCWTFGVYRMCDPGFIVCTDIPPNATKEDIERLVAEAFASMKTGVTNA